MRLIALCTALAVWFRTMPAMAEGAENCRGQQAPAEWMQRVENSVVHLVTGPKTRGKDGFSGHGVLIRDPDGSLRLFAPLHLFLKKEQSKYSNQWVARSMSIVLNNRADHALKGLLPSTPFDVGIGRASPRSTKLRATQHPQIDLAIFDLPYSRSDPRWQAIDVGLDLAHDTLGDKPFCAAWFGLRLQGAPSSTSTAPNSEAEMIIEPPQRARTVYSSPLRLLWKSSKDAMNHHLSGAPLVNSAGQVVAMTQYFDDGFVASQIGSHGQSSTPGLQALFERFPAERFTSSESVVSKYASGPICSQFRSLLGALDDLTQAGLDYRDRSKVLAFPDSYLRHVTAMEQAVPAAVRSVRAAAECGCSAGVEALTNALVSLARVQRRAYAAAEFRTLAIDGLLARRRSRPVVLGEDETVDRLCEKQGWAVLRYRIQGFGMFGMNFGGTFQVSPLDRLLICGIAKHQKLSKVADVVRFLDQRKISDTDVCGALPELNRVLGWQLECPTASDAWSRVTTAVHPDLTWSDLGYRNNWWKQPLLWKNAVKEGLVKGSAGLIGKLTGVSAAALEQDAGIQVSIDDEFTNLAAITWPASASQTKQALDRVKAVLMALPPDVSTPVMGDRSTASVLFDRVVLSLPDIEPVDANQQPFSSPNDYAAAREAELAAFHTRIEIAIEHAAEELQNQCSASTTPPGSVQTAAPVEN
jgi:hypothetical protein